MSRLRFSWKAYLRSLQMSRHQLIVFVEGKECDPYFFGKLCETVCKPLKISYQVRLAHELPAKSGGKTALIEFYRLLRRSSSLVSQLGQKRTGVIFFLDKDIDDLLHCKCRSEHVIYTEYFDVQNHIFRASDFHEGLASAASIDPAIIRSHSMFSGNWCRRAALRWKEWIKLCVFTQKYKVRSACNYRVTSRINHPLNGPLDPTRQTPTLAALSSAFSGSMPEFARAMSVVSEYIDRLFEKGLQDRVFKGKWYATLAELDIRDAFSGRSFAADGMAKRLPCALSIMLDFSAPWASTFHLAVRRILDKLV
ncbi:MAG: hypothetical protein ACYDIC_06605 [Desulfobaccales bacterium]